MGAILNLFDPKLELQRLKYETVSIIRVSREVSTMKCFIHCYEIIDLTDKINSPWDAHPGIVYGDLAAFSELEDGARRLIVYADPSAERVENYWKMTNRFISFWRRAMKTP